MQRPASPKKKKKKEKEKASGCQLPACKNLLFLRADGTINPPRVVSEEIRPLRSPIGREKMQVRNCTDVQRRRQSSTSRFSTSPLIPPGKKARRTFILCFSARLRQLKETESEKKHLPTMPRSLVPSKMYELDPAASRASIFACRAGRQGPVN